MQSVNRKKLLEDLEAVSPGLSLKNEYEQSGCFIFKDGKIRTFNALIFCERPSIVDLEGAVNAQLLVDLLRRMKDEHVKLAQAKGKLQIKGENCSAVLAMQRKILLEYGEVELPGKWIRLPEEFLEGLRFVAECASDDQSEVAYTNVHFTSEHMEATDKRQVGRCILQLPVSGDIYVEKTACRSVVDLLCDKVSWGEDWAHFKSNDGTRLSALMTAEEDFNKDQLDAVLLNMKGQKIKLPENLEEVAQKAEIFVTEEDKLLDVFLKPGELKVKGSGDEGWYQETRTVRYDGPILQFKISPHLLTKISEKYKKVILGEALGTGKLGVKTKSYRYAVCLASPVEG